MSRIPPQDFGAWLKGQRSRPDRVGDLARWYVEDLKQHAVRAAPFLVMQHLRGVHNAKADQLAVLYEAWQEWWPRKLLEQPHAQAERALRRCALSECSDYADGLDGRCIKHSRRERKYA